MTTTMPSDDMPEYARFPIEMWEQEVTGQVVPMVRANAAQAAQEKVKEAPRRSLLSMGIGRFAEPAPVQEWAVLGPEKEGGLLPAANPILVVGQGSVGKTRAAFELGLKIASYDGIGEAPTWMGQKIATVGVSVVLTYEEATDSIHRSIKKMADAAGIDPAKVDGRMLVKSYQDMDVDPMPLVTNDPQTRQPTKTKEYDELTRELREIRQQVGEIGCIVIDNVGTAFAVEGNDYQSANQAMKWIQRWSSEFGALVIVVAHTNKGALRFESDNPSSNELLSATMGSTGWVSAVRLAIVMWKMSEEGEAKIAEALGDDFRPGVDKDRYIRARVVKSNVDDAYTGTITLKRAGGTLEDVSGQTRRAQAAAIDAQVGAFAAAVGRAWAKGIPLQKSGKHGVFEQRGTLGQQFSGMSKSRLTTLVDQAVAANALSVQDMNAAGDKGRWLFDETGHGRLEVVMQSVKKAINAAGRRHDLPAMHTGNVAVWRQLCGEAVEGLSDQELTVAIVECQAKGLLAKHPTGNGDYLVS